MCFLEVVGVVDGSIVVGGRGKGVLFVCLFVCLFVWDSVVVVEWFPYCLFVIGVGRLASQSGVRSRSPVSFRCVFLWTF